jgi:hypothetical protein
MPTVEDTLPHFRCALGANDLERLIKENQPKKYFLELPVQRNI